METIKTYDNGDIKIEIVERVAGLLEPTRSRLNPLFVAWLMNWPTGWADAENPVGSTNFERWETASYRRALLMLSAYLSTPSPKAKIRRTAKKKETEQLRSVWDEV